MASVLARVTTFRRLFFAEKRKVSRQTLALLAFFLVPLTLGVWLRFWVPNFLAADISFETVILLGLLVGPGWAMLSGGVLSVPAVLHHEYLALPFNIALGLAAGMIGRFVEREEIWSFTPFIDLSLYRWIRRNLIQPRIDRQFLLLVLIAVMEMVRDWIAHAFPHRLFALLASNLWLQALVWLCAPISVGVAIKVWNALRVEMSLEEQKRLVLEARLDALQRQINPHFLFNTLNSIASLVRSKPEMARTMTVKLANILRALLKDHDAYVPLRDELKFTDDYLDIEGRPFRLRKAARRKGLSTRARSIFWCPAFCFSRSSRTASSTGWSRVFTAARSRCAAASKANEYSSRFSDDGVGMTGRPESATRRTGSGIGMKNVQERLEVLYGNHASFNVVSNPGRGTKISIELPASIAFPK
ncbi:MAG: sensor histidine kinase [Terracidiphilus sp.]